MLVAGRQKGVQPDLVIPETDNSYPDRFALGVKTRGQVIRSNNISTVSVALYQGGNQKQNEALGKYFKLLYNNGSHTLDHWKL